MASTLNSLGDSEYNNSEFPNMTLMIKNTLSIKVSESSMAMKYAHTSFSNLTGCYWLL